MNYYEAAIKYSKLPTAEDAITMESFLIQFVMLHLSYTETHEHDEGELVHQVRDFLRVNGLWEAF